MNAARGTTATAGCESHLASVESGALQRARLREALAPEPFNFLGVPLRASLSFLDQLRAALAEGLHEEERGSMLRRQWHRAQSSSSPVAGYARGFRGGGRYHLTSEACRAAAAASAISAFAGQLLGQGAQVLRSLRLGGGWILARKRKVVSKQGPAKLMARFRG